MPNFSRRSLEKLNQCRKELQLIAKESIDDSPFDFALICGFRDEYDQNEAYRKKVSKAKWLQSPHNYLPSYAFDIVILDNGDMDWDNIYKYKAVAHHMMMFAYMHNIKLKSYSLTEDWDHGHFEIKKWKKLLSPKQKKLLIASYNLDDCNNK